METRKLKYPEDGERVETGPVQFGDDWQSVHIRGDDAFFYSMSLVRALEILKEQKAHPIMVLAPIRGLIDLLNNSNENAAVREGINEMTKEV